MSDKYTLITGASSGIGTSFAKAYAEKKHPLILVARSTNELEKISKKLHADYSIPVYVISQDLSLENSAEMLFDECKRQKLEINLLINNAGVGMIGAFEDQDIKRVQDMLTLNILTLTKLTHLFLPELKKNRGSIINVSSLAAFQPMPYWAAYAASKAYVLLFSEALHAEVEKNGIHVMALCPGITKTQFLKTANPNVALSHSKAQTPDQVVFEAIQSLENKKTFIVPGRMNQLTSLLGRFLTRSFVLNLSRRVMEKRYS